MATQMVTVQDFAMPGKVKHVHVTQLEPFVTPASAQEVRRQMIARITEEGVNTLPPLERTPTPDPRQHRESSNKFDLTRTETANDMITYEPIGMDHVRNLSVIADELDLERTLTANPRPGREALCKTDAVDGFEVCWELPSITWDPATPGTWLWRRNVADEDQRIDFDWQPGGERPTYYISCAGRARRSKLCRLQTRLAHWSVKKTLQACIKHDRDFRCGCSVAQLAQRDRQSIDIRRVDDDELIMPGFRQANGRVPLDFHRNNDTRSKLINCCSGGGMRAELFSWCHDRVCGCSCLGSVKKVDYLKGWPAFVASWQALAGGGEKAKREQ